MLLRKTSQAKSNHNNCLSLKLVMTLARSNDVPRFCAGSLVVGGGGGQCKLKKISGEDVECSVKH